MTSKSFAQQRRRRRRLLTFVRMCRYGVNNFTRNAWLTIAATAVMTITLLIIFGTVAARNILTDTVGDLRDKVEMSIYLKNETTDEQAEDISNQLRELSSVRVVTYISPEEGKKQIVQENRADTQYLEALNEASNKNPGILRIIVDDINDTSQLSTFVDTNEKLKEHIDSARKPSFAGDRKEAIENIGRVASFAEKVGIVGGLVFVAISSLIIFNTIRMAIFNRKEEIQMMKLIGADSSFIRGPFIVESIVYGFIAAIVATAAGAFGLYSIKDTLANYDISVQSTIDMVTLYSPFVLLIMIVLGALIGVISSLLATHRYLKL